jgi:L-lactate dehydrogenase complex protein LldG
VLRARAQGLPRATNFVSGPSRTADVEQTIQLGAHGPRRVHIVLIGG